MYSIDCSLHLQETGAVAMPASVLQVDSSVKEREDQKLEPYPEEIKYAKVGHVYCEANYDVIVLL